MPSRDEGLGDLHVVVDVEPLPQRQQVVAVQLQEQREARPDPAPRLAHDLAHDAQAVLEGAAVGVRAAVGMRRQELGEQIAVGGVDLDAVEARRLTAHGGRREGVDDPGDLVEAQRSRMRAHHRLEDRRRRDGLLDAGVADDQLATAVAELGDELRAVAMTRVGDPREPRDPVVGVRRAHPVRALALARDVEIARDDEGHTAPREDLVPLDELVGDVAVLARPGLGGRRLEEAARHLEGADPDRIE